jgi:glycosyltransferase involved in cell wall biosynthesis
MTPFLSRLPATTEQEAQDVLIGIDMLGVQSPQGGDRETGRLGRQLVSALLTQDPANRYLLYTHEGMSTRNVPSSRKAVRVSLAPIRGGSSLLRPTIQRVLDQNPDGLDWLILLDPFEPNYGGVPPDAPLGGLKVASLILDLAPSLADDRRLTPLRRHDSILAVSEATAAECRRRLGSASWRVSTIGVACDESFAAADASEPLTRVSGEELGRMGITGPFLFASIVGGAERANLGGIIDAYHRLPFEHRKRHQLVIAGPVGDPWAVIGYLHERGCAEGLVLAGEVDEKSLRTLYRRCSAFLSPSIEEGSGLSLV